MPSYQLPPLELLGAFPHLMGGLFLAMAAFGVIVGLVRGRLRCTPMTALSFCGVTWLVLWFGLARQARAHHVIVTMPLLAITGVLHVADLLRARARPIWVRLWLASALIYAGAVIVVYGLGHPRMPPCKNRRCCSRTTKGLLKRGDFHELRQLIGALRDGPQPTLVGASGGLLNYDLVYRAETQLFGTRGQAAVGSAEPATDSRTRCCRRPPAQQPIVVAMPFQHHLQP